MASDWVQSRDGAFQMQASELVEIIANYAEIWGLCREDLLPLQESMRIFEQAVAEQAAQATLYHATVARKQKSRGELEQALRQMVRRINNHPGMTGELRQRMKLASPTGTTTRRRCPEEIGLPSCTDDFIETK